MKLSTKLTILKTIFFTLCVIRFPFFLLLLPFNLLVQLTQWIYGQAVLSVHKNLVTATIDDRKTAMIACNCEVCKIGLQKLVAEEAYLKTNEKRATCKFCKKPTQIDKKTQKHYCPNCG